MGVVPATNDCVHNKGTNLNLKNIKKDYIEGYKEGEMQGTKKTSYRCVREPH
jgi:hypothetical protein